MAITITIVGRGHNHLRYLLVADNGEGGADTGVITCDGSATPDLLTDSLPLQGPILRLAKCFDDGYGRFAAGALTQAKARALWLSDSSGANVGTINIQRALMALTAFGVSGTQWLVDANVDGSGEVEIQVACTNNGSCYLDIWIPGAIGA